MMSKLRGLLLIGLLLVSWNIAAQETITLLPDQAVVVTVSADQPLQLLFEVDEPQTWVRVQARALADDPLLDPVLWLTDEQYTLLAYDDNSAPDDDINPLLAALKLEDAGRYRLFVDTFSGAGAGEIEVLLTLLDPFAVERDEADDALVLRVWLPAGEIFRMPLDVVGGESLTITARDLSGTLDPLLRLVAEDGTVLAQNDDHGGFDPALDVLDARIGEWVADEEQVVMLEVRDFLARAGRFELLIQPDATTNP